MQVPRLTYHDNCSWTNLRPFSLEKFKYQVTCHQSLWQPRGLALCAVFHCASKSSIRPDTDSYIQGSFLENENFINLAEPQIARPALSEPVSYLKRLNAGGGFLHRLCPPPGLAPCAGRQAHWPPERFIHNFECPRQPCLVKPSLGGNWVRPSHAGLVHPVVGHEAWVLVAFWHDHCASAAHHPLSLHLTFLKRPAKAPSSSDEGWGAMNLT